MKTRKAYSEAGETTSLDKSQ